MNPKQALPVVTTLAPVLAAAPPLLFGAALVVGLVWLFSDKQEKTEAAGTPKPWQKPTSAPTPSPAPVKISPPAKPQVMVSKRITRDDVAEALGYGSRPIPRQEAVDALQTLGFKKTAAYKALSPEGRFSEFLEYTSDGLIEWAG